MSKILISYRREDSADVTGRIYDRLVQNFGQGAIFKDVDSIPLGVDFRTFLDEQVARCEVFLAVIGWDWMKKRGSKGKSRLENPGDFVRIEIESALKRQIPVIPVLVGGASIPAAEQLPASIQNLSYRNGIAVRVDPDFHRDMDRLIEYLKKLPPSGEVISQRPAKAKQPIGAQPLILRVEVPPHEAPFEMVKVSKGPFLYGEGRTRKMIDQAYWIDKYPVTNEKYRAFIVADGYGNRAYWSEEGWKWKTENNIAGPGYWNDPTWNQADCPVVGVSYYEAEAYAKWVGKRLPTELEWEKAARGEDGREYPWGNEFDKNKCNIIDSPRLRDVFSLQPGATIGRTTSVTQYPNGVSTYGCYDMAGNVWEWCVDWYDERKDSRVLRGGSWLNRPAYLCVSNRFRYDADFRNCNIGFRLVQDIP
jgi:formylglycine-generating enzyme required for sulfatase activity